MLPNQMPEPPVDMVMPPVYGSMLVSNFIVLALVLAWIVWEARKTKSLIPILILVGATVASLTECIWDVLDGVWYPQSGAAPLYRLFNVSVPIWELAAYPCYLGGQGYFVYKKLRSGMTPSLFWKCYLFFWGTNFLLEIPVLQMHVYTYYGPQPFVLFGFPLWQAMGNALMPIMIGAIVYTWRDLFTGLRALLVVPLIPIAQIIALGSVGWPTWLAMNSGLGYEVTYPAAIVSFGLSLMIAYLVCYKLCQPARAEAPHALASSRA